MRAFTPLTLAVLAVGLTWAPERAPCQDFAARVLPALDAGDSNGDWQRDLSDAIYLLRYLFRGGPAPAPLHCEPGVLLPQTGDVNDDGWEDLSDAIYLLRWAYSGGPEPLSPCTPSDGGGGTVQRPIEEFVAAQGTFCVDDGMGGCVIFVPPVDNFIGWVDPAAFLAASFDYAGLADGLLGQDFGTTTSGSVTERPLADGRAEVHVRLRTRNALAWAIECDADLNCDFGAAPTIFGSRVQDVAAGAEAALGECFLHVVINNTAPGAPLPDLLQLFIAPEPGQEAIALSFHGRADGTFADGSPGRVQVAQTGLFRTSFQGATADGFPAENVHLLATGN